VSVFFSTNATSRLFGTTERCGWLADRLRALRHLARGCGPPPLPSPSWWSWWRLHRPFGLIGAPHPPGELLARPHDDAPHPQRGPPPACAN